MRPNVIGGPLNGQRREWEKGKIGLIHDSYRSPTPIRSYYKWENGRLLFKWSSRNMDNEYTYAVCAHLLKAKTVYVNVDGTPVDE